MSSIISALSLVNALAEITAGYAKLHQDSGASGASMLQQLTGGQDSQQNQDRTGQATGQLAEQLDRYEFSKTAIDMAQSLPNSQTTGVGQSIAPADIGTASTMTFSAIDVLG